MFRIFALVVVALLVVAGAWFGQPDEAFLAEQWVKSRLEIGLQKRVKSLPDDRVLTIAIDADGGQDAHPPAEGLAGLIREKVRVERVVWAGPETPARAIDGTLHVSIASSPHSATIRYRFDDESETVRRVAWYAVLPPLLSIIAAIIFRRVILCLALGILAGGVLVVLPGGGNPLYGMWYAFYYYFVRHAVLDEFRLEIISFVLLISAIVGLAQDAGGIQGVIDIVIRFCRTARAARIGAFITGLLLFFDDYINCIVVGNALRPLTDRYRVSREKLSFIVDSTAAPVAGLAVVSTWIAFEISQISEGLKAANLTLEPFSMFVRSLPYRFYCMFTLVLVFLVCWTGRDYGPMLKAERRSLRTEPLNDAPLEPIAGSPVRPLARYGLIPIGFTLVAIFVGLWWTAQPGPGEPPITAHGEHVAARAIDYIQTILTNANSARAFSRASMLGFALTLVLVIGGRRLTPRQAVQTSLKSFRVIMIAVVILFLAWAIGAACRDVGTADYLVALFSKVFNPVGFSLVVFGLACLISFAIGSSYSTMAILLPNLVPLALAVGEDSSLTGIGLVTMSIGAVLEGAIFGDHCSPISDTTILSALSSRCDLIEHVRTQMPYALTAMLVAAAVGYVPVSMGVSPYACLAVGIVALVLVVRIFGRRPAA